MDFNYPSPLVTRGLQLKERRMSTTERARLTLELSPTVASLLEHVSEITGTPKTQLVQSALLAALPEVLAAADGLKKRHSELNHAKNGKR